MMIRTRNPATCVGRGALASKMEQSRVGLMSTSLLAASGEPSLQRILGTLDAGDMLLLPLYESTRFVFTYLALAAAVASCELAGPRRSARILSRNRENTAAASVFHHEFVSSAWPCARLTARAVEPLATAGASVSPSIAITSHIIAVIIVPPSYLGRKVSLVSWFHFG